MTSARWLNLRRAAQLLLLGLFVFLLLRTEYRGYDIIRYPVNTFFQLDPLLARRYRSREAIALAGAGHRAVTCARTGLLRLVLPLNLLDVTGGPGPPAPPGPACAGGAGQVLPAAAFAAAASWQAWLLDPFSLLARGLTVIRRSTRGERLFNGPFLRPALRPVSGRSSPCSPRADLRAAALPLGQLRSAAGGAGHGRWQPRFWCRSLCRSGSWRCARATGASRRVTDAAPMRHLLGRARWLIEDGTHRGRRPSARPACAARRLPGGDRLAWGSGARRRRSTDLPPRGPRRWSARCR
jgi:hypothetical protein